MTHVRESPAPHPAAAEKLHEYWVHGEGAAKIGWGGPGDFSRCVVLLSEHMTSEQAKGYCNLAHHSALGIYPATHAKMLGHKGRSDETSTPERVAWAMTYAIERYNTQHAPSGDPTGGQFAGGGAAPAKGTGHGKSTGHGKTPAHKQGPPTHTMAYNPKTHTGPGYGVKGGDANVKKLQSALNHLGLTDNKKHPLAVDGQLGPLTTQSIQAAQTRLGLKPDGQVTPALFARLVALKTLPHRSRPGIDACVRAFQFESRGVPGNGRTLEGYAAVYDTPTKIRDLHGDFEETILKGAFTRSLNERMPVLQFEHGRDPRVGAVPIGQIQDLREDDAGLYVRAELYDNPVIEPVRQAIAGGSIKGMSFRFDVPEGGDNWPTKDKRNIGDLNVFELGPVVFPAYNTTSVTVRSLLAQLDAEERHELVQELAADVRIALDLNDHADEGEPENLTGRSDTRSVDGGDPDAGAGYGDASPHMDDEFFERISRIRSRWNDLRHSAH